MRKMLLLILAGLFFQSVSFADIFELKDGQRLNGRIISRDSSHLKLNIIQYPDHSFPAFIYNSFDYNFKKSLHPSKTIHKTYADSKFFLEKGNYFFAAKDYRNAIDKYEQAIDINPSYVYAYHNIAVSYLMMSEYQQSILYFNKLLSKYPENGYAYLYLAINYMNLEMFYPAREALQKAEGFAAVVDNSESSMWLRKLNEKVERELFPN